MTNSQIHHNENTTTDSVMQLQPFATPQPINHSMHHSAYHRYNNSGGNYQDQKNPTFYPSDRNSSATDSYDHLMGGGSNTRH